MTSQELIEGCKERFDINKEEQGTIEEDVLEYLKFFESQGILLIKDEKKLEEKLKYALQRINSFHWKSFYYGWLEGKLYLNGKNK